MGKKLFVTIVALGIAFVGSELLGIAEPFSYVVYGIAVVIGLAW